MVDPDLDVAERKLLDTDGLRRFHGGLRTDKEKDDFRRHLRRYAQVYLPDCPFEVNSTNRYTIFRHEASITARRFVKRNETVRYLSGIQVVITAEEEAELSKRKKDFSIVVSSRSKNANLFMGPARFANHDCDANARLVTTGQAGIEIVAVRDIDVGDEVTVTYGENYFGEGNRECLCRTCELNTANGWAPEGGAVLVKKSIEVDAASRGYSLRRRRRDDSSSRALSESPSVTPEIRPRVRKTRPLLSRLRGEESSYSDASANPDLVSRKRDAAGANLTTPPVTPAKKQKTRCDATPASLPASSRESSVDGAGGSAASSVVGKASTLTDVTSPDDDTPAPQLCSPKATPLGQVRAVKREDSDGGCDESTPTPATRFVDLTLPPALTDVGAPVGPGCDEDAGPAGVPAPAVSPLKVPATSEVRPAEPLGPVPADSRGTAAELVPARPSSGAPGRHHETASETASEGENRREAAKRRVPGDYTLTPVLLSEPETAWIFCTICNTAFVQRDAYYTRSACPRCERHSKLYGYVWPKTEREGRWDTEERILDHRTIHRFLHADDEAKIRGRKPLAWKKASTGSAPATPPAPRRKPGPGRKNKPTPDDPYEFPEDAETLSGADGIRRSGRARRASAKAASSTA